MRRGLLPLLLVALAAVTMVVPLWAALTSERTMLRKPSNASTVATLRPHPMAEAATLVLSGGVLIGLAYAVRRTR